MRTLLILNRQCFQGSERNGSDRIPEDEAALVCHAAGISFMESLSKLFPLQVAPKTSVPRTATHMRVCPALAGWPVDAGNNRHANLHVKLQTATLRQLRQ